MSLLTTINEIVPKNIRPKRLSAMQTVRSLGEAVSRAEKLFVNNSGWTSRRVSQTLKDFGSLQAREQLLLGGLLLSRAVGVKAPLAPTKKRSRSKTTKKKNTV